MHDCNLTVSPTYSNQIRSGLVAKKNDMTGRVGKKRVFKQIAVADDEDDSAEEDYIPPVNYEVDSTDL